MLSLNDLFMSLILGWCRCELVVACGEETERLASGLLKPFLVHLKAAEEQYGTGTKEIKLTPPRGYGTGGKSVPLTWFTKGTIERFGHFYKTFPR